MYSNKENVNILTALLVVHGIRQAVVCPGSRNAPIAHNLETCPNITCYPATDERSAGFYALGMAQYTGKPTIVCVTSGTALLNVLPAVAEAFYQHVPLIVISADRPQAWIGQQDGQTIPQGDALGRFVGKAVSLPEPQDETERWHCNRLVNETLLACRQKGGMPVHVNVPITEPLYEFTVAALPHERVIRLKETAEMVSWEEFGKAQRPMIVIGQNSPLPISKEALKRLSQRAVVLFENLSGCGDAVPIEEVLATHEDDERYLPDFIIYMGGTLVSKRLKQFLRQAAHAEQWVVSKGGEVCDTFMHATCIVDETSQQALQELSEVYGGTAEAMAFVRLWNDALAQVGQQIDRDIPPYSQTAAVRLFESLLPSGCEVHYANSSAVRLAQRHAHHHVWCNRGVNGIEGSLSTAAGMSIVANKPVFIVIGDLSFFYDSNALWNQDLRGNLHILLLNNGCGGIFNKFDGLRESPARERLVMGAHHTTAEGICQSYHIGYRAAHNQQELEASMAEWMSAESDRPQLLEVFTDIEIDSRNKL